MICIINTEILHKINGYLSRTECGMSHSSLASERRQFVRPLDLSDPQRFHRPVVHCLQPHT